MSEDAPVNTGAAGWPDEGTAAVVVRRMQTKLHSWAGADASRRFDAGEACGPQANMAKLLASEAAWEAADICLTTHGGYGFAVEYDVERKFRETRLFKEAPVGNNLVLAYLGHRVLGLPRSY